MLKGSDKKEKQLEELSHSSRVSVRIFSWTRTNPEVGHLKGEGHQNVLEVSPATFPTQGFPGFLSLSHLQSLLNLSLPAPSSELLIGWLQVSFAVYSSTEQGYCN